MSDEKHEPVGNCAAMREALLIVKRLLDGRIMFQPAIRKAHEAVDAALALPLRQCDVGTAEEQAKRMDAFCESHGERIGVSWRCDKCPLCSIDRCDLAWAQMPYEERGAE